jgi:hypothetical protein
VMMDANQSALGSAVGQIVNLSGGGWLTDKT